MNLNEALKIIKEIAERYERDMQACAVARRIERDGRNAIHAAQNEGSASSGHEDV